MHNADEYVDLTQSFYLRSGIRRQVEAFKGNSLPHKSPSLDAAGAFSKYNLHFPISVGLLLGIGVCVCVCVCVCSLIVCFGF